MNTTYECDNCGVMINVVVLGPFPPEGPNPCIKHCGLCGSEAIHAPRPPEKSKQEEAVHKAAEQGYAGT
jgi:hypothetical protein